jgi:hypothetical protein
LALSSARDALICEITALCFPSSRCAQSKCPEGTQLQRRAHDVRLGLTEPHIRAARPLRAAPPAHPPAKSPFLFRPLISPLLPTAAPRQPTRNRLLRAASKSPAAFLPISRNNCALAHFLRSAEETVSSAIAGVYIAVIGKKIPLLRFPSGPNTRPHLEPQSIMRCLFSAISANSAPGRCADSSI